MLSDVKQDSRDEAKSLREGKPLCFYLPTDDYSSAPSDLKTHITVNKVNWGAFKRANITASGDHKVPSSQVIQLPWVLNEKLLKLCQ